MRKVMVIPNPTKDVNLKVTEAVINKLSSRLYTLSRKKIFC